MVATQSAAEKMSPKLLRVVERAKREPETQFSSLANLLDVDALERSYGRIRKDAAAGVDGVTKEEYGRGLGRKLEDLQSRLRSKRYRHEPIRRVHIPKEQGKTRPIGISTIEDKVVQGALREVLEAVYEPVFRDCSYGFRPGRSAHDALRALNQVLDRGEGNWVLEADIQAYFDSIDRELLKEMLRERITDSSLLRLVGKCLHVGVLDGEEYLEPGEGTVQGSVLSPLLGNVYLHHVLDLWFERDVLPRMRGKAHLIRYADDFVAVFEREDDAKRVESVLRRRFERYGLTLHPEKTRLLSFRRPPAGKQGKGPSTFDLLGFTVYWRRRQTGPWRVAMKTRTARLRRAIQRISDWCRHHRHLPVKEQHAALCRRINGHFNYFGVNGNYRCLTVLVHWARRAWYKWRIRRSQRSTLNWVRFLDMLRDFPLPRPRICVQIWMRQPS